MIIFDLGNLWKAMFFILCDVILLAKPRGKFEIDHSSSWFQKVDTDKEIIVLDKAEENVHPSDLAGHFPSDEGRYAFYLFKHTHEGDYQEAISKLSRRHQTPHSPVPHAPFHSTPPHPAPPYSTPYPTLSTPYPTLSLPTSQKENCESAKDAKVTAVLSLRRQWSFPSWLLLAL